MTTVDYDNAVLLFAPTDTHVKNFNAPVLAKPRMILHSRRLLGLYRIFHCNMTRKINEYA